MYDFLEAHNRLNEVYVSPSRIRCVICDNANVLMQDFLIVWFTDFNEKMIGHTENLDFIVGDSEK